MQHDGLNDLLDNAARRPLTQDEEARVRTHLMLHPADASQWEDALAVQQALRQLPDAPLSSNFTARVLAAADRADRETSHDTPAPAWLEWLAQLRWARAAAMAGIVLCVGALSLQHDSQQSRSELVSDLQEVSSVAKLPSMDMLKDFDFINSLSQTPTADVDLLDALGRDPI
jgi:anti-sigma factor RsiW